MTAHGTVISSRAVVGWHPCLVERCGAVTVDVMAERATCSGGTRATTISRPNAGGEGSTHREGAWDMADKITEHYIDTFTERLQETLEDLDAELRDIAYQSQRAYRADMKAGQVVHACKPTTVFGEGYQSAALDAELKARNRVEALFDMVDRDAIDSRAEVASADEVATVTFALSLEPNEAALSDLYAKYKHNATLRAAIRQAAAKAGILLPIDLCDAVADHRREAREYAISRVVGRWSKSGMAELEFMPSARLDAQSVRQHLMGVDIFGNPLEAVE